MSLAAVARAPRQRHHAVVDPLSTASSWMTLASGALAFLAFVRDYASDAGMVSAVFDPDAQRTAGDEISVTRYPTSLDQVWVYGVKPVAGYTFVPLAVQPEAVLQFESDEGDKVLTPRWFRWLAPPRPGTLFTTDKPLPNLAVDFIVVGYRPEALRRQLTGS